MAAKDKYHDVVARALIKAGWTIDKHQVLLEMENRHFWVDIRASKEAEELVILVEIKGFENMPSPVDYLHSAVGKYVIYRAIIEVSEAPRPLYMAVPRVVYETGILSEPTGQLIIQSLNIKLIVFDAQTEEIVQWIS